MSAMKIKKGDTVTVIAGKDKGKEGKVLAVNAKNSTVLVENVNMLLQSIPNRLLQTSRVESLQRKLLFTSPMLCYLLMEKLPE